MARTATGLVVGGGLRVLERPLRREERRALERTLRALVAWHTDLGRWPPIARAPASSFPDATPYVTLYVDGRVRGCFGSNEGPPPARVARAFLRAATDARSSIMSDDERDRMAAEIAIPVAARPVLAAEAAASLELGTHAVALPRGDAIPALVLPDAASSPEATLRLVAEKAGLGAEPIDPDSIVWLVDVERVAANAPRVDRDADAAADWLSALVARDGSMGFGCDALTGRALPPGPMFHGRCAVALQALAALGRRADVTALRRARAHLARALADALGGRAVSAWPDDPPAVAGTLALAALAGVPGAAKELAPYAHGHLHELAESPWHAAQVVCALPRGELDTLYHACIGHAAARGPWGAWAPWTALAARARGDDTTRSRLVGVLARSLRERAPYAGGADVTSPPETALTALAVEAIGRDDPRAAERGRAFVRAQQLDAVRTARSASPARVAGAFRASPASTLLRVDITAHAVLALTSGTRRASRS